MALVGFAGGKPSPIPTANLVFWSDSTTLPVIPNGTPFATWPDLSPNANNAVAGSGPEQPIYTTNFFNAGTLPAVEFTSLGENLIIPHIAAYDFTNMSIYVVGAFRCSSGNSWLIAHQPANPAGLAVWGIGRLCPGAADTWLALINTGGYVSSTNSVITASVPHIFSFIHNGATLKSYLDTVADGLVAAAAPLITDTGTIIMNHLTTGGVLETGRNYLGEVIIYGAAHSNSDRDIVHNYLKAKWGF